MNFFTEQTRSSTSDPGPPKQGPALAPPEERFGCEIVYEGEIPLKAEYILSLYLGGASNNMW